MESHVWHCRVTHTARHTCVFGTCVQLCAPTVPPFHPPLPRVRLHIPWWASIIQQHRSLCSSPSVPKHSRGPTEPGGPSVDEAELGGPRESSHPQLKLLPWCHPGSAAVLALTMAHLCEAPRRLQGSPCVWGGQAVPPYRICPSTPSGCQPGAILHPQCCLSACWQHGR